MGSAMKGIYKFFTGIFVVKEREVEMEMEIGQPTDVKHVAHIGWDGPSESGPSWMNEFKSAPDFSTSIGPRRDPNTTSIREPQEETQQTTGVANVAKKPRRKKVKSTSSPKSSPSSSTSKHSKPAKSKTKMQQQVQATD
ncbi:hypothetical protein HN51_069152 [Arachis hypogaea]|uniref:CRIB domain-containing protein n=1 Tax=Arachis hypogaea TaxID=3818 RepID=A0A444Z7E0_ARAHY|nr:CRIB domain-containing protein RIC7-like [Arachis ipaensis]XP_025654126.1 CRIB domain-containing protein RIC7 [Arachis hypogaea]XP_029148648.1 CRIB domain-containing protein RIC7 [Arachis hypogaea]QHO11367.1 CRIB domain-containing protein [Arachis hypogaea]RYR10092.1 hypothetical protein Ahy_B05g078561 [Arachis hypogaea]